MSDEGDSRGGGENCEHCKMCRINIIRGAGSTSGLVPPPLYMVTRLRALVTRPISDIIMVSIICLKCFISAALCLAQLT